MLKENYNVAIVGCGAIAETHLGVLRRLRGVEVVAVCDIDEKKAALTSRKWKVPNHYTDISRMLNAEEISILSILTPPSSHAFLAIEAIKKGANVLIEKPLTMTTEEAKSIIDALGQSKAKMTVVYHWLFSEAMLKSLFVMRERRLGEILHANVEALHAWRQDPMSANPNHWSHQLLGGRFGEMLPHPVYILQSILGDDLRLTRTFVAKRRGPKWMPNDELHAVLRSGDSLGSLYVSFNAPRGAINVDVYGTKEILEIDLATQTVLMRGPRSMSKLSIAKDTLSIACKLSFLTIRNALKYAFRAHGQRAVSNVYTTFIDSIANDTVPLVTPEMAYNTVRIVEEICKGINKEVALSDDK